MVDINEKELIKGYTDGISIKNLSIKFECSPWVISDRIKKLKLDKRKINWQQNKEIILTNTQMDIIIGSLLGDGSIILPKNCKNSYFSYISSEEEHVRYIYSFLKEFMTDRYKYGPVRNEVFDKRTNKTYVNYVIRTKSNITLEIIRKVWYDNIKIIPDNLILNPLICKIWYIGDGGIVKNNRGGSQYIKLSTDGFEPKYVIKIIKKLSKFDARIQYRNKNKTQSAILIPRIKIVAFLNYISDCPVNCYEYKWNYVPCKSDKIDKNGVSNIKKYEKVIIDNYLNGFKISELVKKFKCDNSLIRYHLKKNNIEIYSERPKYKIKYNDENIIIDNLKKYCLDNNIIYGCLFRCIKTGKKYKNIYIEKIK